MLPNVGLPELILLFVIALLVFGPQRMVGMGTAVGKAIREFRRALQDRGEADSKPESDEDEEEDEDN